eukprot:TRINITY_DN16654_c0_g1_i2.p2 TRINITY_DN16654_c0_g1~~TRINITY_DN16654_c0_g1_i2.p2  ORF type:complete len:119 (-),score=19.69 TRINITY_DN16654_c0_g1_i2:246-602(-)
MPARVRAVVRPSGFFPAASKGHGGELMGDTARFGFVLMPADVTAAPSLVRYLQSEQENRCSVGLLLAFANLLDEGGHECNHCRLSLELSSPSMPAAPQQPTCEGSETAGISEPPACDA